MRFMSSLPFPKADTPMKKPMSAGAPAVRELRARDIMPAELIRGRTRGVELDKPKVVPAMPKNVAMYKVLKPPAV